MRVPWHLSMYPRQVMSWQGKTTLEGDKPRRHVATDDPPDGLALVVVWAPGDGGRLGEVMFPSDGSIFGRGPISDEQERRVGLVRQLPGESQPALEIDDPFLSRSALGFGVDDDGLSVEAIGRRPLRVDDAEMKSATIREGDYFELQGLFGFVCVRRPLVLPTGGQELTPSTFGHADAHGIVGQSPAVWALRAKLAFFGKRNAHVLVTGTSGTGKELVAQAIHRLSSRAKKDIVARNAATFPSGLIDAELFGNLANYPSSGMPERPGLVGQADGSTLFLDEIGELPSELQAHLLRVLDGGEYQRLGESKRRIADIRLIAATNRNVSELKEDLGARLALRVHVPGLDERREDVMLIARHLLLRTAARDPQIGEAFFEGWDGKTGEPRVSAELARALTLHAWSTHVRELDGLLWRSASSSKNGELALTDEVAKLVKIPVKVAPSEVTAEAIQKALERHGGVKDKAWRDLGLPSRHALHRLMKKLNVPE